MSAKIDRVFSQTPQFVDDGLSGVTGARVVLKVETLNPIRSFKGRGADLLVSEADPSVPLCCASAGNFGQAMAYACRKRNLPLTVYASTNANALKVEKMKHFGANVILHGEDFDAAKLEARRVAQHSGGRFVEDSLDIETLEGAATIGVELLQFPEPIDTLLIALGNGALLNGIARIYKERSPHTSIIAVQAKGAPAMVESWQQKKIITHPSVNTIADGVAVRLPVPQALQDMEGMVDDALLVDEASIIQAMKLIHLHSGVATEPSGALGIAALLENKSRFANHTVATVLCGGNLTEHQMKVWLH
ncbi:threonine ammonia-lyase [Chryseolinea lacunae]|uniref:threonine ammonia-lyase n=1 Tax=Chryseolinea lacunae TaxID=2801331 RepID=UPI0034E2ACD3